MASSSSHDSMAHTDANTPVGILFKCNAATLESAEDRMLLGATKENLKIVKSVRPGTAVFILDTELEELHTGFEAASEGRREIEHLVKMPSAVAATECTTSAPEETPLIAQIRIRRVRRCAPIARDVFQSLLFSSVSQDELWDENRCVPLSQESVEALRACRTPVMKSRAGPRGRTQKKRVPRTSTKHSPSSVSSHVSQQNAGDATNKVVMTALYPDDCAQSEIGRHSEASSVSSMHTNEESGYASGFSTGTAPSDTGSAALRRLENAVQQLSVADSSTTPNEMPGPSKSNNNNSEHDNVNAMAHDEGADAASNQRPRKSLSIVVEENDSSASSPCLNVINICIDGFLDNVIKALNVRQRAMPNDPENHEYDMSAYSGDDATMIWRRVGEVVRNIYASAVVQIYGSFATGLWLPGQSDLDLLITLHHGHALMNEYARMRAASFVSRGSFDASSVASVSSVAPAASLKAESGADATVSSAKETNASGEKEAAPQAETPDVASVPSASAPRKSKSTTNFEAASWADRAKGAAGKVSPASTSPQLEPSTPARPASTPAKTSADQTVGQLTAQRSLGQAEQQQQQQQQQQHKATMASGHPPRHPRTSSLKASETQTVPQATAHAQVQTQSQPPKQQQQQQQQQQNGGFPSMPQNMYPMPQERMYGFPPPFLPFADPTVDMSLDRGQLLTYMCAVHSALKAQPWCKSIKLIKSSSMPVIKMKAVNMLSNGAATGPEIPVDISFRTSDHYGLQARDFVLQLTDELSGVLRPLVLILKRLLREYDLHDVYKGGLGSYSLTTLVVFFLLRVGFVISGEMPRMNPMLPPPRMATPHPSTAAPASGVTPIGGSAPSTPAATATSHQQQQQQPSSFSQMPTSERLAGSPASAGAPPTIPSPSLMGSPLQQPMSAPATPRSRFPMVELDNLPPLYKPEDLEQRQQRRQRRHRNNRKYSVGSAASRASTISSNTSSTGLNHLTASNSNNNNNHDEVSLHDFHDEDSQGDLDSNAASDDDRTTVGDEATAASSDAEILLKAAQVVECATRESRKWLREYIQNDCRGTVNVGVLLMGFLQMFSRPSRGGLDLEQLELSILRRGSIRVQRRRRDSDGLLQQLSPLCVRDPVRRSHCLGSGSFNMYMVQQRFGQLHELLMHRPNQLSDLLAIEVHPSASQAPSPDAGPMPGMPSGGAHGFGPMAVPPYGGISGFVPFIPVGFNNSQMMSLPMHLVSPLGYMQPGTPTFATGTDQSKSASAGATSSDEQGKEDSAKSAATSESSNQESQARTSATSSPELSPSAAQQQFMQGLSPRPMGFPMPMPFGGYPGMSAPAGYGYPGYPQVSPAGSSQGEGHTFSEAQSQGQQKQQQQKGAAGKKERGTQASQAQHHATQTMAPQVKGTQTYPPMAPSWMDQRNMVMWPAHPGFSGDIPQSPAMNRVPEEGCTIVARNIPYEASAEDFAELEEKFRSHGEVLYATQSAARGSLYITYVTEREARRAMSKLQGHQILDREIRIKFYRDLVNEQSFFPRSFYQHRQPFST